MRGETTAGAVAQRSSVTRGVVYMSCAWRTRYDALAAATLTLFLLSMRAHGDDGPIGAIDGASAHRDGAH